MKLICKKCGNEITTTLMFKVDDKKVNHLFCINCIAETEIDF